MRRLFLCCLLLVSGCSATSVNGVNSFKTSEFCKDYKCKVVEYTDTTTKFSLRAPGNNKYSELYYSYSSKSADRLTLYLPKGSLMYSVSPDDAVMIRDLFSWFGLKGIDLKRDILASSALVDNQSTDFAEIKRFILNKYKMVAFIKSVPDPSLKLAEGRLAYGIIDVNLYPPTR